MLILIAESKTMTLCDSIVDKEEYSGHRPVFEPLARNIMDSLSGKTPEEIASKVGISLKLAREMQKMIYEFPNQSLGSKALDAFTGVVFRALDMASLGNEAREKADRELKIVSSLYGWLNADDIVKQYRTEYSSPIAPLEMPLFKYYRHDVTLQLCEALEREKTSEILNLLPADAAKSIDWKIINRQASVYKADFLEQREDGILKTPNSGKLKKLRGLLLRQILMEGIDKAARLLDIESPFYYCDGASGDPHHLRLVTAE